MKILHINDFFFPYIAGPTKHIHDVIHHTFSIENHFVATFDYFNTPVDVEYDVQIRRFKKIEYNEVQRFLDLGYQESDILTEFIKFVRNVKPTCIVLYFIGFLPLLIRHALPEMRIVYMPFGYSQHDYDPLFRNPRMKIALCGNGCKQDFINAGANPCQIHVIERPINSDYYKPTGQIRDSFRILFVGRFHKMKRVPALIEALIPLFKDYSKLKLHIVADTDIKPFSGAQKEEIDKTKEIIKKNSLSDKIILRGRKTDDELLREYSEASVHILPSTLDRRATVTQEAITMGLQCINTCKKSYDWPEYTDDGKRMIHYVEEIEDMIPVIRNMLNNPQKYTSNREYALKHWSWEKWKPVYEKLMTEW